MTAQSHQERKAARKQSDEARRAEQAKQRKTK